MTRLAVCHAQMRRLQFALQAIVVGVSAVPASFGCAAKQDPKPAPALVAEPPKPIERGPLVSFDLETLDGTHVSTESSLGRATVIGFITTYDLASQAEANFLRIVSRGHVPRTNVYAIVLELQESRPIVQAFADSLNLRFPIVLIDPQSLARTGLSEVHSVPSVVILDRDGRRAWRQNGIVEAKEIDAMLRTIE